MPNPERPTSPSPNDSMPTVSFSIALGGKYDYVDFDYPAYIDYLHKKGLSNEQISKANIDFTVVNSFGLLSTHSDSNYCPKTNETQIAIYPYSNPRGVNKHILHETQHMIDENLNVVSNYEKSLFLTMCLSEDVAQIAGPCSVATFALSQLLKSDEMLNFSINSGIAAIAGFALSETIYFALDPGEKRARKAASDNNNSFVKLRKKSNKHQAIHNEYPYGQPETSQESPDWIPDLPEMEW